MPRYDKEHLEQKAFVYWASLNAIRFPVLGLLYSIPNGGKRPPKTAARMVAEGLRAGVWDLHLPVCGVKSDGTDATGLWIEMKSDTGKLTENQIKWRDALSAHGNFEFAVCHSWVEAAVAVCKYLKIKNVIIDGVTSV